MQSSSQLLRARIWVFLLMGIYLNIMASTYLPECTPWSGALPHILPWLGTPWALALLPVRGTWLLSSVFLLPEETERNQSQISAPVKGKVQQVRLLWRCWALQTVSTGLPSVTGGIAQATRTVSCAHGKATWSPLPNLAPRGRLLAPGYYSRSVTRRPKNQLLIQYGSRHWSSNRTRGLSGFIHVAE